MKKAKKAEKDAELKCIQEEHAKKELLRAQKEHEAEVLVGLVEYITTPW